MKTQSLLLFLLLFGINSAAQELAGPDRIQPGSLASFELVPAQEASWHIVTPLPSMETYQVDTGESKLYFASPQPGRYTVIAGIIHNGRPELLVKTFFNGEEDERPIPVPIPPVSSLEAWITIQLPVLVTSESLVSESRLVAECFEQIVQRIETENIRTVQNAQAQLQIALTGTLALASPTAVTDWTVFLAELSQRLETELGGKITDLAEVKKVLQSIAEAMQSFAMESFEQPFEVPDDVRMPLPSIDNPNMDNPNMDNPNNRGQGTPNRVFRSLLTR